MGEVDKVIKELKNGKSVDPAVLVSEVFKKGGKGSYDGKHCKDYTCASLTMESDVYSDS